MDLGTSPKEQQLKDTLQIFDKKLKNLEIKLPNCVYSELAYDWAPFFNISSL